MEKERSAMVSRKRKRILGETKERRRREFVRGRTVAEVGNDARLEEEVDNDVEGRKDGVNTTAADKG